MAVLQTATAVLLTDYMTVGLSIERFPLAMQDFEEGMGDRRQELVFIGIDMQRHSLCSVLDGCLLTETEMQQRNDQQQHRRPTFTDPFAEWPSLEQILDAGEEDDGISDDDTAGSKNNDEDAVGVRHRGDPAGPCGGLHQGDHDGQGLTAKGGPRGRGDWQQWRPGSLIVVKGGGAEVQGLLDALEPGAGVAVLVWHAEWCETCRTVLPALHRWARSPPCTALSWEFFLTYVDMILSRLSGDLMDVDRSPQIHGNLDLDLPVWISCRSASLESEQAEMSRLPVVAVPKGPPTLPHCSTHPRDYAVLVTACDEDLSHL